MASTKLNSSYLRRRPAKRPSKWYTLGSYYVAGLMHHDYDATKIKRGQKLQLFHERSNPVDQWAVSVWVKATDKWRKVGYIQAGKTHLLHDAKGEGKSFWCMVNQHDLGNNTDTRLTVLVKVTPFSAPVGEPDVEL